MRKSLLKTITLFSVVMSFSVSALMPVTGIWGDASNEQKRTGYMLEVQNGLIFLTIYSYAENKATTDPTWYIVSGKLKETNKTIKDEKGKSKKALLSLENADILTVENNQKGEEGNVNSGKASLYFTNNETLVVHWNDFNAHVAPISTIKKYWLHGGLTMEGKRIAAVGQWQYAMDSKQADYFNTRHSFIIDFFDPLRSENTDIYSDRDKNVLIGKVKGDNTNRFNVAKVFSDEFDYTVIYDLHYNTFYHFKEMGGGVEYSVGQAAIIIGDASPSNYPYTASIVRRMTEIVSTPSPDKASQNQTVIKKAQNAVKN